MRDLVRSVDDVGSANLADFDCAALEWQLSAVIGSRAMELDRFLVCGLDSLGQHCVLSLKEFGVRTIAIDWVEPQTWEVPNLVNSLDELIIGDCRQNSILEQAKIERCRAALLVTNNEQVNVETALAIRQLNPHTRLVVRSAKANLNELLSRQLGNFIAYEPTELPAQSFALAALGTDTVGFFNLDGYSLRVIQEQIGSKHPWLYGGNFHEQIGRNQPWSYGRILDDLNTGTRRIIAHSRAPNPLSPGFHQWESEETVYPGDMVIYIESADQFSLHPLQARDLSSRRTRSVTGLAAVRHSYQRIQERVTRFWKVSFQQQDRRVVMIYGLVVLTLLLTSTLLYDYYYPGITQSSAFFANVVLLLGGYGDVFGGNLLQPGWRDPLPMWLRFFSLGLTLVGTVLVGILYGFVTEMLLSRKFQLLKHRPPVPLQDHVVIVGLGRVGQRVAKFLHQFKQPLVGISFNPDFNQAILPDLPLIVGDLSVALSKANLADAKSVVVVTDDEILNLEVALMVQAKNPHINLVIRTSGQRLSQHLMAALPSTRALGMDRVAAEVFAGVAFGENIINLFHLNHQTILVTEYQIETGDKLNGLLLAEVAYGYDVVPILHHRTHNDAKLMPTDDVLLAVGDRLVVLATIEGLQRVEVGTRYSPIWQVRVEKAMTEAATFEGGNIIGRISGYSLSAARELMHNLPGILNVTLYKPQAERLVHALEKSQITAQILPISAMDDLPRQQI
jgi:Trk K+ transport system NAD-binding subunit